MLNWLKVIFKTEQLYLIETPTLQYDERTSAFSSRVALAVRREPQRCDLASITMTTEGMKMFWQESIDIDMAMDVLYRK